MYLIYKVVVNCLFFLGEMVTVVAFLLMETEEKKKKPVSRLFYLRTFTTDEFYFTYIHATIMDLF